MAEITERPPGFARGASTLPDALAAIDIGTNSVHMLIARIASNDRFEVLTRQKDMVRLGSGRGEMRELSPDAIDRGIAALTRCRMLADSYDAPIFAVATSAVREARNAEAFIRRAREEAGVEINVIAGVEEARLILLGVMQALPVYDSRVVVIDVGGGSTEVIYGRRGNTTYARSIKLGSLRMTRRFFPDGVVEGDAVQECRRHVRGQIAPIVHEAVTLGHDTAVACSGTAEALATIAVLARGETPPQKINATTFSVDELTGVIERLAEARTPAERRRIPGVEASRADILLGGAIVLEQICRGLEIEQLTISDYALREGVLLDALHRLRGGTLHHLSDLRRSSVFHLMELCDDDPDHSLHVARLALQLHDAVAARIGLDDEDRELLEAAALLCNVGMFISHSGHHKHSYYVIRSSEHLMGFTEREIELIALVARYHRKSRPSPDKHEEFARLDARDQEKVRALAAVLRVAIGLDRNHDDAVERVEVIDAPDRTIIRAVPVVEGADLSIEVHSAAERADMLADALGTPIEVVAA